MQRLTEIGYNIFHQDATTLIYRPPLMPEMIPLQGLIGRPTTLKGRRPIRFLEPNIIIRELVHGGVFAQLTADRFLSPSRSVRELLISRHLIANNVRTPEILGMRIIKPGLFSSIAVISRLVPNAIDLLSYLQTEHANASAVFKQAGSLCRQMHDLKVYHADLQLKNFLLDKNMQLWLLDLDKARHLPYLPYLLKNMNIARLFRSCRKWHTEGKIILPEDYKEAFRHGYKGSAG